MNPLDWYRKIKALVKINKEIRKMNISELKTSEGRMTLVLNLVSIYGALHGFIPAPLAAKIAVISIAAYAIARSLVKAAEAIVKLTPSAKDDVIVEEAGKILDAVAPKPPQA